MPRQNQPRSIGRERALAERIASERHRLKLGVDSLAKRMTEAGCPIRGTAIRRIEDGDPPRTISVDELFAFAAAFDTTVEWLLRPQELVDQERAAELLEELQRNERNLAHLSSDVFNALVDLALVKGDNADIYDFVMGNWAHNPRGLSSDERAELSDGEELHVMAVNRAAREARWAFMHALLRAAGLWLAATRDGGLADEEADDVRRALEDEEPWIRSEGWLFEPGEVD